MPTRPPSFVRTMQRETFSKYAVADHELTPAEIERCYGSLIETAFDAFTVDPSYIVRMAQNSTRIMEAQERIATWWDEKRAEESA